MKYLIGFAFGVYTTFIGIGVWNHFNSDNYEFLWIFIIPLGLLLAHALTGEFD